MKSKTEGLFISMVLVVMIWSSWKAFGYGYIPNAFTDQMPAAAVLGDRLYIAYKDRGSDKICLAWTQDPNNASGWTVFDVNLNLPDPPGPAQIRTSHAPALSVINDALWIAFKGHNNPFIWLVAMRRSASGPTTWTGYGRLRDAQTSVGPALGASMLVHRGDRDDGIWYQYVASAGSHDLAIADAHTSDTPSVGLFGPDQSSSYVIVFKTANNLLKYSQFLSPPGQRATWTPPEEIPNATSSNRPGLAIHNRKVFVAYQSATDSRIFLSYYDRRSWIKCGDVPQALTNEGPSLVSFRNKLYVIFKGHYNDRVWWTEVPGTLLLEFMPQNPGWITRSSNDETCNRCAQDPVGDINQRINGDPTYNLSYRSGNDSCSVWAPTVKNGHMPRRRPGDLTIKEDHRQGIQRLFVGSGTARGNYFLVSCSARGVGPGFEVVRLGDLTTPNEIGQTDQSGTRSLCTHRIIAYHQHDNAPYREHYNHAGGIQAMGRYVVTPLENEEDQYRAAFRLADLRDPTHPRWGDLIYRQHAAPGESNKNAGAAAITRLNHGIYLIMIFGMSNREVEVFVSKSSDFSLSASSWESTGAWATGLPGGQNAQLVTSCDGRLYLLSSSQSGEGVDRVILFNVAFSNDGHYRPTFTQVATHHMYCRSANTGYRRFCDFGAGAGPYVDSMGRLIVYSVERWAYIHLENGHVYGEDGNHVGVREFISH